MCSSCINFFVSILRIMSKVVYVGKNTIEEEKIGEKMATKNFNKIINMLTSHPKSLNNLNNLNNLKFIFIIKAGWYEN